MIGYTITGYDVSHISCLSTDEADLPTNLKNGSIAIITDATTPTTKTIKALWNGTWTQIGSES